MGHPLAAGLISAAAGWILFFLYRRFVGGRMNQAFRDAGPEHHKRKGRVPTGAGLVIVLAMLALAVWTWFMTACFSVVMIFIASAMMGLLGFVDDRAKVRGGSAGLKARFKLPAMLLTGTLLLYSIHQFLLASAGACQFVEGRLPRNSFVMDLPVWLFYLLGLFIWLGAMNGSNFTDGLDGLLASSSIVTFGAVWLLLFAPPFDSLAPIAAVVIGLLIAYLCFNWKPATLYVGDSGSLSLGALAAGLVLFSGQWLYLGLIAIIWVLEVLSVMIQVVYFRLTKGKRLFLMTPVHHHFELAGWSEVTIVIVFALLQAWGCLSAWLWLNYSLPAGIFSAAVLLLTFLTLLLRYRRRVA